MKAVVDTNVYISAFVFGKLPRAILEHAEAGSFELIASNHIREEIERTLRDKFQWPEGRIIQAIDPLWEIAHVGNPSKMMSLSRDKADDQILACAMEASADVVVTGDNDLLDIVAFEGIPILSPRQFFVRLNEDE